MPVYNARAVALRHDDGKALPSTVTVIERVSDGRSVKELRDWRRADLGKGAGFRTAPLLRVVGEEATDRFVLVGRWHIWLDAGRLFFDAIVEWAGSEARGWNGSVVGEGVLGELLEVPFHTCHRIPDFDDQSLLTVGAKATCEASRDAVASVRALRLDLEGRVAASMAAGSAESPSWTLPLLINLGIAVTRARDEARDAVREGLSLWYDDDRAYQSYRRARDSSLISNESPADAGTRSWMRTHDAGVRQCEAMAELLGEESSALSDMIRSAGVMAQIHDAESADTLNKVASAAAVGIGLPSLGLAYFGADRLFDLDKRGVTVVLGAVLLPTLLAVVVATFVGQGRRAKTALLVVLLALCLLLCLVLPTVVSQALDLGAGNADIENFTKLLSGGTAPK